MDFPSLVIKNRIFIIRIIFIFCDDLGYDDGDDGDVTILNSFSLFFLFIISKAHLIYLFLYFFCLT